ncbi:N-acylamino acid racemase (plasmid) [Thermus thermophilus]|uniref:NAD(P)/FAD-dependent oxidoreductase n=1 Tax=Thermus thermophilus TaxID=274 RepID=UPI001C76E014|nr:FAD-dependent oxidoreductase [Thermus thermophilus]BCZ93106.1 N-acylamino acid racemase [Thermus thermophilus]
MYTYRYLIVGGGMAGAAAALGIREVDREGTLGLLSAERDPPYNRPPLSKGLWQGKPLESIFRNLEGVDLHLGRRAVRLDPVLKEVEDERGARYRYERLLLATGARPRRLPLGEGVVYFRTLEDYRRLRGLAERGRRFAVIGGGFIGQELAAALRGLGKEVVLLFPEEGLGERLFPRDLARFLVDFYRERGVEVRPKTLVTGLEQVGEGLRLRLSNGEALEVDGAVAGVGVEPETGLLEPLGLPPGVGIPVDEEGRVLLGGRPLEEVYAAGDVALFYSPALGRWMRVEHEDHANTHGLRVGRNMAGEKAPYHHLPFFYSDLFELGYEAVGLLDPRLETVADWKEPYREGVIYYLEGHRVRGVLLWNAWNRVERARELIAEKGPHFPEALKGRL